jgi:hypothetical protein
LSFCCCYCCLNNKFFILIVLLLLTWCNYNVYNMSFKLPTTSSYLNTLLNKTSKQGLKIKVNRFNYLLIKLSIISRLRGKIKLKKCGENFKNWDEKEYINQDKQWKKLFIHSFFIMDFGIKIDKEFIMMIGRTNFHHY